MSENRFEKPKMYALSTCPRCNRVKQHLKSLGVNCDIVDVDLLSDDDRHALIAKLRSLVPVIAFPIIFTNDKILYGSDVDEISRVFGGGR